MLYWNIFTVLFGALIAALSPRTWKPFIARSSGWKQILSFLLVTMSVVAFMSLWSMLGYILCHVAAVAYTQPNWASYALTINFLIFFVFIGVPLIIIQLLARFLGRILIDPAWKVSYSLLSCFAAILFGAGANLLGFMKNIGSGIPSFYFWPVLGATIWLFFVIKTDNAKTVAQTITGIGLAAIVSFALYIASLSEPIGSIITTTIRETHHYNSTDLI